MSVAVALAVVAAAYLAISMRVRSAAEQGRARQAKPEAPPDLAKLRDRYASGIAALQRGDAADAVQHLSSFDFGRRAVEEYRLYYLANAYQLHAEMDAARVTLARLAARQPRMIYATDALFNLAALYTDVGDADHAADTYAAIAKRTDAPDVAAAARWSAAMARLQTGDLSGALYDARSIVIHTPRAAEAPDAIALVRSMSGIDGNAPLPLTPSERLDRAVALRASDPEAALSELDALAPVAPQLADSIRLERGLALNALRRYEDSNKQLEPLTSSAYKYAVPALRYAAKNYAIVSASIDPTVTKIVKEKKRVGMTKVRVGKGKKRHTVTRPKYQTVSRTVKLVDLAKKNKKDEYDRLSSERLRDLLQLPIDDDLRLEVLNALLDRAQAKNQTDYVQQLVPQVIRIDSSADPGLQYLWDRAWAAYVRGDLGTAKPLLQFISSTYTHPNVRRQAEYWYARTLERTGGKEDAAAIYRRLASAPYQDLYALHSVARGAPGVKNPTNPLKKDGSDWSAIAEKEMPDDLRLAFELTSLTSMRDAFLEVRRNMRRQNMRFAQALLADIYNSNDEKTLMYRALRVAWPQLATVDQDSVPVYFLKMYYPVRYRDDIEDAAKDLDIDPNLVRALILQESYYNPEAKSRVGATGLMQLMPSTASDYASRLHIPFAASRLENPSVNVKIGTYHLKMLINMFSGNTYLAVAAYNAGQGNVMKWRRAAPGKPIDEILESIPFAETRNYVKRVIMLKSSYQRITS